MKEWCYGKQDLLETEDCSSCHDKEACFDLSFKEIKKDE